MISKRVQAFHHKLDYYITEGKKIFLTSSFQSQSLPLLHIISTCNYSVPVYFLNTGYLFPESIQYKNEVSDRLNLNTIELRPETPKHLQKAVDGNLLFVSDPDHCCYVNKIHPLEKVLIEKDVWINGVRADQSRTREKLKEEMKAPFNVIRYHPMLKWSAKMIHDYIEEFKLPRHPLEDQGYISIGCEPCTRSHINSDENRSGRWFGLSKTECGLHIDLAKLEPS